MPVLSLPTDDGGLESDRTSPPRVFGQPGYSFDRIALLAADVGANPLVANGVAIACMKPVRRVHGIDG